MKFTSNLVATASGTMGGLTAARNRYGQYFRRRSNPVNPNTTFQQDVRSSFSSTSTAWASLTPAQRDAWDTYAINVPIVPAKGGAPVTLTGNSMFLRLNGPRLQVNLATGVATLPILLVAPTEFSLCTFTGAGVTLNVGPAGTPDSIELTDLNADDWNIGGGYILIYASRQVAPTINFFKGPYRLAGLATGASTPITSANVPNPFDFTEGNKAFIRMMALAPDGRISSVIRTGGTIV
jgi:hypothetical protein